MEVTTNSTDWPGARITGIEGSKVLCHFSDEVDKKSLSKANIKLDTNYLKFKPWMTRSDTYVRFRELDKIERVKFSTNKSGLELLKTVITDSADNSLRAVDPNAQENVSILLRDNENYSRFEDYLNRYLTICGKINPSWNIRLSRLVHEINPIIATDGQDRLREDGSGLSSLLYRKAIFLSLPKLRPQSFFEFALNVSHEIGHQALMVYENIDDIVKGDQSIKTYSVIRKAQRPAIQSFHAVCATVYMLEFILYSKELLVFDDGHQYIKDRINQLLKDLREGIDAIQEIKLTNLGDQLISEFKAFLFFTHKALYVE